jgi:hypothetical protein
MQRLALVLTVLAATCFLNDSQAHADFPLFGLFRSRPAVQKPSPPRDRQSPADRQRPYDDTWFQPELYPKYYGGFHGRVIQNYGYPSGDIGVRGAAW